MFKNVDKDILQSVDGRDNYHRLKYGGDFTITKKHIGAIRVYANMLINFQTFFISKF